MGHKFRCPLIDRHVDEKNARLRYSEGGSAVEEVLP